MKKILLEKETRMALPAALALAVLFSGCSLLRFSGYPAEEMSLVYSAKPLYRVEPSTTTPELWRRQSLNYEIQLKLEPEFPGATDYVKISVAVTDTSKKQPAPMPGAKISCKAIMPNVPGYVQWLAENICYFTETKPGFCEMKPVVFGTGGDWDLVVKAEIPGVNIFSAVFPVTIKGPPWPPNHVP